MSRKSTDPNRKYYPTAIALYITYFVLGVCSSILGLYKQAFALQWGAATLPDGTYDVSGVVSVIAAMGLGRLVAYPFTGPIADRLGRRFSGLIGCFLYTVFLLSISFTPNIYLGYFLCIVNGVANSFLDTCVTPSCMEIFKEKGTIANIFTKLSISIAQFILPFMVTLFNRNSIPFNWLFIITAIIMVTDAIFLMFLPFPPFEKKKKEKKEKSEKKKLHISPSIVFLVCLGFTTSSTFMLWMNCNQELGALYGLADPGSAQSFYSIGIVAALFISALLLRLGIKETTILILYPTMALVTLILVYFIRQPWMVLTAGFLMGFFAAGGVLQLVTAVANNMFPKSKGLITSVVMIASSLANFIVLSIAGGITKAAGEDAPKYVVLFNMGITLIGIILAVLLLFSLKKEKKQEETTKEEKNQAVSEEVVKEVDSK